MEVGDVNVEVFVVKLAKDLLNEDFKDRDVDDHASGRQDAALHRDLDCVVVAVAVVALAEDTLVVSSRQAWTGRAGCGFNRRRRKGYR